MYVLYVHKTVSISKSFSHLSSQTGSIIRTAVLERILIEFDRGIDITEQICLCGICKSTDNK